jgi:large subunit ribosomal protein L21
MQVVYAVIRTGGKQYRVKVGDVIDVEKLPADDGADLSFEPLLVVEDDGTVRSQAGDLAGASVSATVVDQHRGKKIRIFTYKNKTGQQRHMGHRQSLTRLRVAEIEIAGGSKAKARTKDKDAAKPTARTKAKEAEDAKEAAAPVAAAVPEGSAAPEVSAVSEVEAPAEAAKAKPARRGAAAKPKAEAAPKSKAKPAADEPEAAADTEE